MPGSVSVDCRIPLFRIKAARKRAAPARPRPAGDLRPASAGPAGHVRGRLILEDLGAPPRTPTLLRDAVGGISSPGTTRATSLPGRGQGRSLGFLRLDGVPGRRVGWVWLKVVCRQVAMDERPPSQPRAPWPLIEICESSHAKELPAGSSEVTWIRVLGRTAWRRYG